MKFSDEANTAADRSLSLFLFDIETCYDFTVIARNVTGEMITSNFCIIDERVD